MPSAWLEDHYKDAPGIWEQFDLEDAANSLDEVMSYDYSTEMCGDKPATYNLDADEGAPCEICGHRYLCAINHWWQGDYADLPELDLMRIMKGAKKTTRISYNTAEAWLKDHYRNVPGIWEKFSLAYATIVIRVLCDLNGYNSCDEISDLDLMRIMSDVKMWQQ